MHERITNQKGKTKKYINEPELSTDHVLHGLVPHDRVPLGNQ